MADKDSLLHDVFGFAEFREGQEPAIDALLAGRSALAVFPTGGGKSLCYQLPALLIEGLTVVVSPLIALMKDQIDFLQSKGVAAAKLDSSLDGAQTAEVTRQIRDGELKLLYVAPERFNNERFVAEMTRNRIGLFAIDEAHCISEWGHNFRPDYLKLAEIAKQIQAERILALTATATPSVVDDICLAFDIDKKDAIVTGFHRPNLTMLTTPVTVDERFDILQKRLMEREKGPTIVYVTFQRTAEVVADRLRSAGLPAFAYHAGMDSEDRTRVQDAWMAADDGIVVATIAFGMGIDKRNVRYVYHYNLPKSLESYSQEMGRAGRDGLSSTVEMLACSQDVPALENFVYGDTPTKGALRSLMGEIFAAESPFSPNLYELSSRHDLRPLVLKTALTYLELLRVLHQGTPIYAGYEFKAIATLPEIFAAFEGKHGQFVKDIFGVAKKGRIWFAINPEEAAAALGTERKRVIRALEVLAERGLLEMRASDVRTPYTKLQTELTEAELAEELYRRFKRREELEISRLRQVTALVEEKGCQTAALVGYFGQVLAEPCGHCTFCLTHQVQDLNPPAALPITINPAAVQAAVAKFPETLSEPSSLARFLLGLSSPSFSKQRLTKDPLFGKLEAHPFEQVQDWCRKFVEVPAAIPTA